MMYEILIKVIYSIIVLSIVLFKVFYIFNPDSDSIYANILNRLFEEKVLTFKSLTILWNLCLVFAFMLDNIFAYLLIFISLELKLLFPAYYAYCRRNEKILWMGIVSVIFLFSIYVYWLFQLKIFVDKEVNSFSAFIFLFVLQLIIHFFDPDRGSLKKWFYSLKKIAFSGRI